jgi:hypothetical protein
LRTYGRKVFLQKTGLKKLRKAFNLASQRLRDPLEIDKIGFDLVNSAKEEIQMVFSTANTFSNQEGAAGNPSLLKLISDKIENEDNLEVRI